MGTCREPVGLSESSAINPVMLMLRAALFLCLLICALIADATPSVLITAQKGEQLYEPGIQTVLALELPSNDISTVYNEPLDANEPTPPDLWDVDRDFGLIGSTMIGLSVILFVSEFQVAIFGIPWF